MEVWAWLTVYLVGFALLQLVLYRYFRQGGSGEQPAGSPNNHGMGADAGRDPWVDSPREQADHAPDSTPGDASGGVRCKHCGAVNESEATFTYCRECAQPLQ
jgi:hypothetical protein